MNKKLTILMIALGAYCQVSAQTETKTLFNSDSGVSPFLSADFGMANFGNSYGRFTGLKVGMITDMGLMVGLYYRKPNGEPIVYDLPLQRLGESAFEARYRTEFDQRGLALGFSRNPSDLFHVTMLVYGGIANFYSSRNSGVILGRDLLREQGYKQTERSTPLAISPTIIATLNITKWMKFSCGAGYQVIRGIKSQRYNDGDFSGMSYEGSIILGWFN